MRQPLRQRNAAPKFLGIFVDDYAEEAVQSDLNGPNNIVACLGRSITFIAYERCFPI